MKNVVRLSCLGLMMVLCCAGVLAQSEDDDSEDQAAQTGMEEVVVVSASRTEQNLNEVPAAMTVLSSKQLEQTPADDYGDYLRNVPGLNVSQMSARDVQITGRSATSSLATSQLVLLDNRSLYLDFFGFVMWDFAPIDPTEIKQIEVVRGPGSAVWGANAMSGVINMITKSPKEMPGTTVTLGGGELDTLLGSVTHAGVKGKLGYKVTASYYEQDPYDRPTGTIPGTASASNPAGTQYPPFENQGTKQPKVSVRFDYEQNDEVTWSFSGGHAETDGIIHSGIGPFDIESGTGLSFAKVDWRRGPSRVTFFANLLDGDADNLLTVGVDSLPLGFIFKTETFNLDYSDTRLAGTKNILTFGATARRNQFDLSIAPEGDDRNELGVYLQDEVRFTDKVSWLIGARWDDLDPIGSVVSPRTSLLIRPSKQHSIRASFNRAFRQPSAVQNFLDTTIFNQVDDIPTPLGPVSVVFPSDAFGNPTAVEEQLDAIEVGYVGSFGKTTFTLSIYRNETEDSIDFFESEAYPADRMDPQAAGVVLTDDVVVPGLGTCSAGTPLASCPVPGLYEGIAPNLPLEFSYRNIGKIEDQGVELTLNVQPTADWSFYFNYSWQDEPDVTGIPQETLPNGTTRDAISTPPETRANAGFAYSKERWFVNANVNFNDDAFWTDVLDARFWGPTDDFTMVNLGVGVNFTDNVTLSVNGQNVFDEDVQQHIFGDLISRKVTGRLHLRF